MGLEPQLAPTLGQLSPGVFEFWTISLERSGQQLHLLTQAIGWIMETIGRWDRMQIQPLKLQKKMNICSNDSFKRSPKPWNSGSTADKQHRSGGQAVSHRQKPFQAAIKKIHSTLNFILETNEKKIISQERNRCYLKESNRTYRTEKYHNRIKKISSPYELKARVEMNYEKD